MKRITRWTPDTCGCTVEYEWDDEIPNDQRIHEFKNVLVHCSDHAGLKKDKVHFDHIVDENQTKNRLHAALMRHPKTGRLRKDERGNDIEELQPGIEFEWSFSGKDHNRRLSAKVKGVSLTVQEKNHFTSLQELKKGIDLS